MKIEHQLRAFESILQSYDGKLPLHRFLANYFKQHKQMGSSDRRWASRYLYSFYRLGNCLSDLERNVRLAAADFLCNDCPSLVRELLPGSLVSADPDLALEEKIELVTQQFPGFRLTDVFPFTEHLSAGIDIENFERSFFIQPDLFLRADEVSTQEITGLLADKDVPFKLKSPGTIALPNATKLEQLLPPHLNYRVQDLSSQYTGTFFKPAKYEKWWDCCAASGGKSMLLHEQEPLIDLLVSDVRESVLENLDSRFRTAGIKKYQKKVIDLLQNNDQILHHYMFDGIILDAPCSGSGTWGRTPEMITFFKPHSITFFSKLQRSIATNIVKYLKPGKPLIYITCSVFKEENEETIAYLTENLPLELETMEVIKGYGDKADTMFVARLLKSKD